MSESDLRIAIIGAGIGGLCAAIALREHSGVDVQIYERSSRLQEIGASIALGPNGLRTLERLGVTEALGDDIGFRNKSGYPMIYRHWKTNEVVSVDEHHNQVEYRHQTARFYRVHLQQALAAHIDASRLHFGKTFSSVEQSPGDNSLVISFADGSTTQADILLGADGIRSAVRQHFVPSSAPRWTGWLPFRAVFDADLNLFTIVGGYHSDPDAADALYRDATWNTPGDIDVLKSYYKDWNDSVRQMVAAAPYIRIYPNTFASSLDTWVHGDGRVTFVGDAAHAHGGAFAAGGSLAADDAYSFASAIFHVIPPGSGKPSTDRIREALRLHEATREKHTDRVLATVQQGNKKAIERLGKEESDEELRRRMLDRGDPYWIHEHAVEAAFAAAVAEMEADHRPRL